MTMEITRYLRAPSLTKVLAAFAAGLGIARPVTSSCGRHWVSRFPVMKSASGRLRLSSALASSTEAPSASRFGTPSAAGEALQRLPTMVPAFCTCTPPTSRAAAFRPSKQAGSSARSRSVQVTRAPMCQRPPSSRMSRRPASAVMSSTSSSSGVPTRAG